MFCSKEESTTYEENWQRKDESCHVVHDDYENKTPKSCGCKYETVVDYHFNASQKLNKRSHQGRASPKRPRTKSSSSFKTFSDRLLSPTITSLARSVGATEKEKPRSHTPHPMSERAVIIYYVILFLVMLDALVGHNTIVNQHILIHVGALRILTSWDVPT